MALGVSPVGRLLDLVLLGPAIFGRDACRGVADAPLGSDYVVATDQVADLARLEVAPRQELQSRLDPVLFWKLHQSVGGQVAFRVVRRELAGVRCRAALGRACRGW